MYINSIKTKAIALITHPLFFFVFLALFNTVVFGFTHQPSWQDASEYSGFASNLILGNGYSLDGEHFSMVREPGYPFFVAVIYILFGNENLAPLFIVQGILLGAVGFFVYFIFKKITERSTAIVAGSTITLMPLYGYYAGEVLTEIVFMFLLMSIFTIIYTLIITKPSIKTTVLLSLLLGLFAGYTTLVRVQFLFFIPGVLVLLIFFKKYRYLYRYAVLTVSIWLMVLSSWAGYVYYHTQEISLTQGRQEVVLHLRAARTELSYGEQVKYLGAWLSRSIPGSDWKNNFYLKNYEWSGLSGRYDERATSPEVIEEMKKKDIDTILQNPGRYAFGNLVEVVKLHYIEHVKSPVLGKGLRVLLYALIYIFFIYALVTLWKAPKKGVLFQLQALLLLFVGYNVFILTFFDTIPRYNIPYLVFYIMIGHIGILMSRQNKLGLKNKMNIEVVGKRTIDDFGEQWMNYTENPGFYGAKELLLDIFGPLLTQEEIVNTKVAEIGSGTGRIVNMLLDNKVGHVVAVEPSEAMKVMKENTKDRKEHITYLQVPGDTLPKNINLDYIFSIGVIHHIPDPVPTLKASFDALKSGGRILIWIYGNEGNGLYLSFIKPIRFLTQRLPHVVLTAMCSIILVFLNIYIFLCKYFPLPMKTYMRNVLSKFPNSVRHMTIYDQLNPAYSKYYSKKEAEAVLSDVGFENIQMFHRHGYSWTVIGTKPM